MLFSTCVCRVTPDTFESFIQIVTMSRIGQWVMHFSSGDKLYSGQWKMDYAGNIFLSLSVLLRKSINPKVRIVFCSSWKYALSNCAPCGNNRRNYFFCSNSHKHTHTMVCNPHFILWMIIKLPKNPCSLFYPYFQTRVELNSWVFGNVEKHDSYKNEKRKRKKKNYCLCSTAC